MSETMRPAEVFPPGEFLREELEARGWSQTDLAAIMGCAPRTVNEIIKGRRGVSPETAVALAAAFGTSADFWLGLEMAHKLHTTPRDEAVARRAELFTMTPVKDLQRRGWIEQTRSIDVLEHQVRKFLVDQPHAAKKAASYETTAPALRAWLCRVRHLAEAWPVSSKFSAHSLDEALERIKLLLHSAAEVRNVPRILAEAGIRFVVVEHLPHSKVDGAALWLDAASPVVAISCRYDRIDWFWFALIHELIHVRNGDGKEQPHADVALVGEDSEFPEGERKVNAAAADFLVSQAELSNFIARIDPLYSRERVKGFAARLKIHPALVVGQLQHKKRISPAHMRDFLEKVRATLIPTAVTDGWGYLPTLGDRR